VVQRHEVAVPGRIRERLLSPHRRLRLVDVELDRDVRIIELGVGGVDRASRSFSLWQDIQDLVGARDTRAPHRSLPQIDAN
jgi:hypothetical protein